MGMVFTGDGVSFPNRVPPPVEAALREMGEKIAALELRIKELERKPKPLEHLNRRKVKVK